MTNPPDSFVIAGKLGILVVPRGEEHRAFEVLGIEDGFTIATLNVEYLDSTVPQEARFILDNKLMMLFAKMGVRSRDANDWIRFSLRFGGDTDETTFLVTTIFDEENILFRLPGPQHGTTYSLQHR